MERYHPLSADKKPLARRPPRLSAGAVNSFGPSSPSAALHWWSGLDPPPWSGCLREPRAGFCSTFSGRLGRQSLQVCRELESSLVQVIGRFREILWRIKRKIRREKGKNNVISLLTFLTEYTSMLFFLPMDPIRPFFGIVLMFAFLRVKFGWLPFVRVVILVSTAVVTSYLANLMTPS